MFLFYLCCVFSFCEGPPRPPPPPMLGASHSPPLKGIAYCWTHQDGTNGIFVNVCVFCVCCVVLCCALNYNFQSSHWTTKRMTTSDLDCNFLPLFVLLGIARNVKKISLESQNFPIGVRNCRQKRFVPESSATMLENVLKHERCAMRLLQIIVWRLYPLWF